MKPYPTLSSPGRALRLRRLDLAALENYDLEFVRLRLVSNSLNGIFRLYASSGESWILRVGLPETGHTRDHREAEMAWLAALAAETDLTVPKPLRARDGSWVVEASVEGVPEARLCQVFSWVPGSNLAQHMSPANLAALGELAARLHQHARNFHPPDGLDLLAFDRLFPFPEPVVLFDPEYESYASPEQRSLFQHGGDWAQQALEGLKASGEPMRLLHADLHQWNIRCLRGRLSPIDFEDLMWGWPVQ